MGSSAEFVMFENKLYSTLGGDEPINVSPQISKSHIPRIKGTCKVTKIWVATNTPISDRHAFIEYKENGITKTDRIFVGCTGGWIVDPKIHPSVYCRLPFAYQ